MRIGLDEESPWRLRDAGPAVLVWAAAAVAMAWLDGRIDLVNLAMLLVLASALASLWLPGALSAAIGLLAVVAFNWYFVPPRRTFSVDLRQDALLLAAMVAVTTVVSALMGGLRTQARRAQRHARRAEQLREWGETLRDAADPLAQAGQLRDALAGLAGVEVALLLVKDRLPERDDEGAATRVGNADSDQSAGLWHCLRQGEPMGPGTARHAELPDWYLPMRGRGVSLGAAVLRGQGTDATQDPLLRAHAQALCDQMGQALQRTLMRRDEQRARDEAQSQAVRNALLAAISHDFRTPLATIMGAASSLAEQGARLDPQQRQRLATSIVDEAAQLSRLTDNTLQLARLDSPGVALRCDWESAEELVGTVLRHARRHDPARRVRARLEPGLPLLWCDALLLSQLLDNLVDNALKYSPAEAPVEVLVRRQGEQAVLAVRDRGPGIAPAWRERVFEVFRRGELGPHESSDAAPAARARAGAGVGLAVCRAIARAHGGELRLRPRGHGGCSFECVLPLREQPPQPPAEDASA
ncbi:ATP-binding protein [Piscinibacter sp.]|jgi:two-component system sensor histidine kinase KdpD|uniref:sensor histidine kinase n=1 Tax=Piscinibacter sp. TaxID=1903157 RepID=UPI001B544B73|nr:ATP-binding protein [Piscinibacter sp.]MBK7530677.1 DUF4118 domain-containing protein [Piscinibacter sp.]MBP6542275.1 DUF4118 domain-containing protein [Piscinibacter sp.]